MYLWFLMGKQFEGYSCQSRWRCRDSFISKNSQTQQKLCCFSAPKPKYDHFLNVVNWVNIGQQSGIKSHMTSMCSIAQMSRKPFLLWWWYVTVARLSCAAKWKCSITQTSDRVTSWSWLCPHTCPVCSSTTCSPQCSAYPTLIQTGNRVYRQSIYLSITWRSVVGLDAKQMLIPLNRIIPHITHMNLSCFNAYVA